MIKCIYDRLLAIFRINNNTVAESFASHSAEIDKEFLQVGTAGPSAVEDLLVHIAVAVVVAAVAVAAIGAAVEALVVRQQAAAAAADKNKPVLAGLRDTVQ